MKRCIIEAKGFTKNIDDLISKKKLLLEDFDALKKMLCQNPEVGDLVIGAKGIWKIKGKSSSNRVSICH